VSGSVLQSCSSWGDPKTALCAKSPEVMRVGNRPHNSTQLLETLRERHKT
jgi:hypothetical protein